jgi:putative membrane protein
MIDQAAVGAKITEIESKSSVELVVAVVPRSGAWPEAAPMAAIVASGLVFAGAMLVDHPLSDEELMLGPLAGLVVGWSLGTRWPALGRLFTSERRRAHQVELFARAAFQKAGLHHTRASTAVFAYLSLLERRAVLVPDRGARVALAPEAWRAHEERLCAALHPASTGAVLAALQALGDDLAPALPRPDDDTDELPSHVEVTL